MASEWHLGKHTDAERTYHPGLEARKEGHPGGGEGSLNSWEAWPSSVHSHLPWDNQWLSGHQVPTAMPPLS